MAGEWKSVLLGEVITLQRGFDLPSQDRHTGSVPIVSSSGVTGYHSQAAVNGPGVVTGRYGTIGQVFLIREDYWPLNTTLWVKDFHGNDPQFASYLLRTIDFRSCSDKSSVPGVNRNDLHKIPVTLPTLPTQRAIAHVLGTLDDLIELNRETNEILEEMARALFKSWFVDFDPVRAKLEGGPSGGMDAATAALFPDHFQDSELGQIPKGWEVKKLGACIGFRSGFSFKSQDWQESGVPVVKIGSVKPGIIDLSQVSYVSEEIAQQAARYRLNAGDILIGMTGYVGVVGIVPPSDNPPLLNQRVGKFVMPRPGTESLAFWYCTTRQAEFRAFVESMSHGTAQANVSGESIMEFSLVVPPAGILDVFNQQCRPLLDLLLSNYAESRDLATLRDTLLPKLLSGEIAPPVAEELIATAC